MSFQNNLVATGFDVIANGATVTNQNYVGLCSATAQSVTVTDGLGQSRTFNMAAGKDYPVMITGISAYAGATGDLIAYKA